MAFLITFQEGTGPQFRPMNEASVPERVPAWSAFNWRFLESNATWAFEQIVEYAMFDGPRLRPCAELCEMRLRSKAWNTAVCKILHSRGIPLYSLRVNGAAKPHILTDFAAFINSPSSTPVPFRTVQVRMEGRIFLRENHALFFKFFRDCGQHMTNLELYIPATGVTLPGIFIRIAFPALRSLRLHWNDPPEGVVPPRAGEDNNRALLLSLLQAAPALKELWVRRASCVPQFALVRLPLRLRFLSLHGVTDEELHILTGTKYKRLKTLELSFKQRVPPADTLYQILKKQRRSLRRVLLDGRVVPALNRRLELWFPRMRALEQLQSNFTWKRPSRHMSRRLAQLTTLTLSNQDDQQLKRWINLASEPMATVTHVKLGLCGPLERTYEDVPLTEDLVLGMRHTFPNLRGLQFGARVTNPDDHLGIHAVFGNLSNLQELVIDALNNNEDDARAWNVVLLGGSPTERFPWPPNPSVMSLTQLRFLQINWTRPMADPFRIGDALARQLRRPPMEVILETGRTLEGRAWEAWLVDGNAEDAAQVKEEYRRKRDTMQHFSLANTDQFEEDVPKDVTLIYSKL